ncbi:hypothetical protein AB1I64_25000 [[Clostridium] symbiosum]
MRYHYEKPPIYLSMYGQRYCCDHPVYNHCTLFLVGERGLAVIQQRYDPETKHTFWAEVDEWLTDPLYLHPRFRAFFDRRAGTGTDGLYPTVTIRQIMWALKMKPLPKQPWETVFDHTIWIFGSTGCGQRWLMKRHTYIWTSIWSSRRKSLTNY